MKSILNALLTDDFQKLKLFIDKKIAKLSLNHHKELKKKLLRDILAQACKANKMNAVNFLLEEYSPKKITKDEYWDFGSIINYLCKEGNLEFLKAFEKLTLCNLQSIIFLESALDSGNELLIDHLMSKKIKLKNKYLLIKPIYRKQTSIIIKIVDAGYKVSAYDITISVESGLFEVVRCCLEKNPQLIKKLPYDDLIYKAISSGNVLLLQYIEELAILNKVIVMLFNPDVMFKRLKCAGKSGNFKMIQYLLEDEQVLNHIKYSAYSNEYSYILFYGVCEGLPGDYRKQSSDEIIKILNFLKEKGLTLAYHQWVYIINHAESLPLRANAYIQFPFVSKGYCDLVKKIINGDLAALSYPELFRLYHAHLIKRGYYCYYRGKIREEIALRDISDEDLILFAEQDEVFKMDALFYYSQYHYTNDLTRLRLLLNLNFDPDKQHVRGDTLIEYARQSGGTNAITSLLKNFYAPNVVENIRHYNQRFSKLPMLSFYPPNPYVNEKRVLALICSDLMYQSDDAVFNRAMKEKLITPDLLSYPLIKDNNDKEITSFLGCLVGAALLGHYHPFNKLVRKKLITTPLLMLPLDAYSAEPMLWYLLDSDNKYFGLEPLLEQNLITSEALLAPVKSGSHQGKNIYWLILENLGKGRQRFIELLTRGIITQHMFYQACNIESYKHKIIDSLNSHLIHYINRDFLSFIKLGIFTHEILNTICITQREKVNKISFMEAVLSGMESKVLIEYFILLYAFNLIDAAKIDNEYKKLIFCDEAMDNESFNPNYFLKNHESDLIIREQFNFLKGDEFNKLTQAMSAFRSWNNDWLKIINGIQILKDKLIENLDDKSENYFLSELIPIGNSLLLLKVNVFYHLSEFAKHNSWFNAWLYCLKRLSESVHFENDKLEFAEHYSHLNDKHLLGAFELLLCESTFKNSDKVSLLMKMAIKYLYGVTSHLTHSQVYLLNNLSHYLTYNKSAVIAYLKLIKQISSEDYAHYVPVSDFINTLKIKLKYQPTKLMMDNIIYSFEKANIKKEKLKKSDKINIYGMSPQEKLIQRINSLSNATLEKLTKKGYTLQHEIAYLWQGLDDKKFFFHLNKLIEECNKSDVLIIPGEGCREIAYYLYANSVIKVIQEIHPSLNEEEQKKCRDDILKSALMLACAINDESIREQLCYRISLAILNIDTLTADNNLLEEIHQHMQQSDGQIYAFLVKQLSLSKQAPKKMQLETPSPGVTNVCNQCVTLFYKYQKKPSDYLQNSQGLQEMQEIHGDSKQLETNIACRFI